MTGQVNELPSLIEKVREKLYFRSVEKRRIRNRRKWLNRLRRVPGVTAADSVAMVEYPIVTAIYGEIILKDGVILNSSNHRYHANMFGPVKLFVDRPGAVIEIGEYSRINGACLHAYNRITIGKRCLIGANTQIIDADGHELSFENVENRINTMSLGSPIAIEDDVWIGIGVIVLPGVRIGRGAVIGAGSVVTKDIPPMSVAAGNPARVVKTYESEVEKPNPESLSERRPA